MLKLFTMLVAFLLVALALLGLRQRRLELTSQSVSIYSQIRERNETLLDQKVAIAQNTNPWALRDLLQRSGVNPGAALQTRDTSTRMPTAPGGIETDLTAPVRPR